MDVKSYCEPHLKRCNGTEYVGFCEDLYKFDMSKDYYETPLAFITMFLGLLIIYISIFGKIDGTYKYCVINASILHLLWPVFYKIVYNLIIPKILGVLPFKIYDLQNKIINMIIGLENYFLY